MSNDRSSILLRVLDQKLIAAILDFSKTLSNILLMGFIRVCRYKVIDSVCVSVRALKKNDFNYEHQTWGQKVKGQGHLTWIVLLRVRLRVCLSVCTLCWAQSCHVQKRLKRSRSRLGCQLVWKRQFKGTGIASAQYAAQGSFIPQ